MEKEKILAKYFVNERKIMLSLENPFIIRMVKSMKNQYFCFLLIEYINGINLEQYLSNREYHSRNFQGKGYSLSCDFWSPGICMYEIFYGKYPFGNYANEVVEMWEDALKNNFSFPIGSIKVLNINIFIKNLLNKKSQWRNFNVNAPKKKTFFDGFEFDKLIDFRLKPPSKPIMKSYDRYLK